MAEAFDVPTVMVGPHRLYAEVTGKGSIPIVLMHGFPDNIHLYDRILGSLISRHLVVRFDFLGWGRSDKPREHRYTATNQVREIDAVVGAVTKERKADRVILVAHDASGPPAIDWALANPEKVAGLVLLNTYYHWMPELRRPPVIALYSTPIIRSVARAIVRRSARLDRALYSWQVGGFIRDRHVRDELVLKLYEQFPAARHAFWQLNNELLGVVLSRRKRLGELRRFTPPVRVIFGARDRYLNAGVGRRFAAIFPNSELHLIPDAGHYVQVDSPEVVATLIGADWTQPVGSRAIGRVAEGIDQGQQGGLGQ